MEKEKYTCEELEEVVRTLRGEHGCPWDKAQTFQSLRTCLIEEAYEYLAAVRIYENTGNAENMREELGDLLLQVVMNSQIAAELNLFSFSEVAAEISAKMIRRHPHVFGGQKNSPDDGSRQSWDEIKKREKEGKTWIESPLREIPMEHPGLIRGPKVLKKADKLYGQCPNEQESLKRLEQEIQQLGETAGEESQEQQRMTLLGEILLELCNLSRIWKLPLEQILQDRIEKLITEKEPEGSNC